MKNPKTKLNLYIVDTFKFKKEKGLIVRQPSNLNTHKIMFEQIRVNTTINNCVL